MSLPAGFRFGPYEILSLLGAGGMGEVYRAHDAKLNRDVAIKILSGAVADDPERLARFEREAHVLAALNHPHIAAIYGFEDSDSAHGLVMELVEGETLAEKLARTALRPLPFDEVQAIARQIAQALEAAHEQGIVHRDLKPANIKVRPDGMVKLLDFGLAKAAGAVGVGGSVAFDPANSPTLTSPAMTRAGIVLGTAAYMSPEQARGRDIDKRADIWAFGVVLYEMLTGRRLFDGETVSDTIAAVLTRAPDLDALPTTVPPRVRTLIARCLERDPKQRLRDIGEARIALDASTALDSTVGATPASASETARSLERTPRRLLPVVIGAAIVAVLAAVLGWSIGRRPAPVEAGWERFTQLTDQSGEENAPVISPDGSSIAYASRARGTWDIYLQRIGGRNPILVAGDPKRDEAAPAFSPDGTQIAFHEEDADGGIFVVGATGESARRVTDAGFHPAWSPDGKRLAYCMEAIVDPHSRAGTTALWIVDAGGGTPHKLFDGDAAQPVWSPSGQRIAFWGVSGGQRDIYTIAVGGGAPASVTEDAALDWSPVWSPDGKSLYFSSDRGGTMNIWRIGIDEASGKPVGKPEPVTNGVAAAAEEPSFSRDGSRLVFRARIASVNPVRLPFDLAREEIGVPEQLGHRTGILTPTSVSPDGQWLALTNLGERQEDVFIARTDGSDLRRITDDVARDRGVRWSADGKQLLFYSNRSGKYGVWSVNADGGNLRQLSAFDSDLVSLASSPDGRVIATPLSGDKAFLFDPAHSWTDQQPKTIAWSPDTMMVTDVSPDGKKLVGASYSNQGVVIVDPAGGHSVKLRGDLSIAVTKFLPDGRRLLAVTVDGRLMVIDTATGQLRVVPTPFRVDTSDFTLSPDGKTIYLGRSDTESDVWMVERRR